MRGLYISKDSQVSPGLLTLTARLATENAWFTSHRVPHTPKLDIINLSIIINLQIQLGTILCVTAILSLEVMEAVVSVVVEVALAECG